MVELTGSNGIERERERAYDEHDSTLVWLNVHPRFDAPRSEPRFVALVKRMGLD